MLISFARKNKNKQATKKTSFAKKMGRKKRKQSKQMQKSPQSPQSHQSHQSQVQIKDQKMELYAAAIDYFYNVWNAVHNRRYDDSAYQALMGSEPFTKLRELGLLKHLHAIPKPDMKPEDQ